jgi:hypothetical protein
MEQRGESCIRREERANSQTTLELSNYQTRGRARTHVSYITHSPKANSEIETIARTNINFAFLAAISQYRELVKKNNRPLYYAGKPIRL